MAGQRKKTSFEEKMRQLEEIVSMLESGQTTLDESMKIFEQGMELSLEIKNILENAEQKITILKQKSDGQIIEQKFDEKEL